MARDKMRRHLILSLRHNQQTFFDVDDMADRLSGLEDPSQFRAGIKKLVEIEGMTYAHGRAIIDALRGCDTEIARAFLADFDGTVNEIRGRYGNSPDPWTAITDADLYPLIILKPHEKICNTNHQALSIEVRGEANLDGCLFSVRDVDKYFGLPNLEQTLIDSWHAVEGVEYHYLMVPGPDSDLVRCMYITSLGLIQSIDKAEHIDRESFARWFRLYTPERNVVNRMNNSTILSKFSSMFALHIGCVKDLRSVFDIDVRYTDEARVGLIGTTRDLRRTYIDSVLKYGRYHGIQFEIMWMGFIPVMHLETAQERLEDFCTIMPECIITDSVPGLVVHEPGLDIRIYKSAFKKISQDILQMCNRKRRKLYQPRTEREAEFILESSNIFKLIDQLEAELEPIEEVEPTEPSEEVEHTEAKHTE